jgi:hypothetical protein
MHVTCSALTFHPIGFVLGWPKPMGYLDYRKPDDLIANGISNSLLKKVKVAGKAGNVRWI